MRVLVDTSVWSLSLRRRSPGGPTVDLQTCGDPGLQHRLFLICAGAYRHQLPILTTDGDFTHFARVLPVEVFG